MIKDIETLLNKLDNFPYFKKVPTYFIAQYQLLGTNLKLIIYYENNDRRNKNNYMLLWEKVHQGRASFEEVVNNVNQELKDFFLFNLELFI